MEKAKKKAFGKDYIACPPTWKAPTVHVWTYLAALVEYMYVLIWNNLWRSPDQIEKEKLEHTIPGCSRIIKIFIYIYIIVQHWTITWMYSNSRIFYVYSINADVWSVTKHSQSLPIK